MTLALLQSSLLTFEQLPFSRRTIMKTYTVFAVSTEHQKFIPALGDVMIKNNIITGKLAVKRFNGGCSIHHFPAFYDVCKIWVDAEVLSIQEGGDFVMCCRKYDNEGKILLSCQQFNLHVIEKESSDEDSPLQRFYRTLRPYLHFDAGTWDGRSTRESERKMSEYSLTLEAISIFKKMD